MESPPTRAWVAATIALAAAGWLAASPLASLLAVAAGLGALAARANAPREAPAPLGADPARASGARVAAPLARGTRGARPLSGPTVRSEAGAVMHPREYETSRPLAPGDSLKDLDWKRLARGGPVLVKEWERHVPLRAMILLDASTSARASPAWRSARSPGGVVGALAEDAIARGYAVGFVAFDEWSVLASEPPAAGRAARVAMRRALAALPGPVALPRSPEPSREASRDGGAGMRAAIATLRGRRAGAASAKHEAAAEVETRLGEAPGIVILATDLGHDAAATMSMLAAFDARGHRVGLALLAPSDARAAPGSARDEEALARRRRELEGALVEARRRGIHAFRVGEEGGA